MRSTRRQALQAGAMAVAALADADQASAATRAAAARERSFDAGWLFFRGDATGAQAPAFDDSKWRKLDLPHDWRIEDIPEATSDDGAATANPSAMAFVTKPSPDGTPPDVIGPFDSSAEGGRSQGYTQPGVGWYRKHFTVPGARGKRVELRFDGLYEYFDVYLNGKHLGFRPNGYIPALFDLTPHLKAGRNVLAVKVDDTGQTSRWYSGAGIYRHTWLTVTDPVHVPTFGVYVSTPVVADTSRVVTRVEVRNTGKKPAKVQVRNTLRDPRGRSAGRRRSKLRTIKPGRTAVFSIAQSVSGAQLWAPETPNRYTAHVEVLHSGRVVDRVDQRFGIRSLVFNGKDGFLLNGKKTTILGGNVHHNFGPLGAVALGRSEERRVQLLKAAGFNSIRTAHNPPTPSLLEACDRLGMLVWDEYTDMWEKSKSPDDYSKYFPKWFKRDLTMFIRRDRNHPSVIIWSIGNEISTDESLGYGATMAKLIRKLDKSRPVARGASTGEAPHDYLDIVDTHYGNISSQLSGQPSEHAVHGAHAQFPDKAASESESFPASIYENYRLAVDNPWFIGSWVWAAWDYQGESGCGATPIGPTYQVASAYALAAVAGSIPYPWFQDFQSDIDLIGQLKPQNAWRKVVYGLSKLEMMVERPPPPGTNQYKALWGYYDELRSWTWDVPPVQLMKVRVYTSGDSVKLLLNGSEVATNSVAESDERITTFSVPYSPGELTAVASLKGQEIARQSLKTTGKPAALRLTSDAKSLTTSRDALAHVLVEVVDDKGQLVPDAVTKVSFAVSGAGELLAVGNANPHNVDSFRKPRRWTWHGQALAILRPAKRAGTLTLTASAEGLQGASVSLKVAQPRRSVRIAGLRGGAAAVVAVAGTVLGRRMRLHGERTD